MGRRLLLPLIPVMLVACGKQASVPAPRDRTDLVVDQATMTVVPRHYTVPGGVIADERVQLSSRISGFIRRLAVREGEPVREGQVLVEIDPSEVEGAVRRAAAALASAKADLADARVDVEKFTALTRTGAVSIDTLRKAEVRRDVALARLAEAQAALETANAQRAYTSIASPVDGVVVARLRESGDLATPGLPILEIEARDTLVFQTFVAESRVARLDPAQPVRVELDAVPGEREGRLLRVVPSADPVTRRYEVKVSLPAAGGLLPGMFGRARFLLGEEQVLMVPRAALTDRGGLIGVFRVASGGLVGFRWLRTRREIDGQVEVTAGLEAGDRVVLNPPPDLRDGDRLAAGAR
ncbi:efflux RND transporter periplasmic adaptor subunit [Immundisolibacter sp.]|uniref:efflux RND transporter periplasmic adaptor subunit n=1 Tax=Immundisolibacter sp. TaxID=1934948 RepID=UPI0026336E62|nr:efflux RND transporter periplasmic adaptor subunit [Immundisolibacter sp.]MDD3651803.1 efflux RND transporter periplasmic adaptor subunit [Immundisolibacter sp.]